jgi:hypothetical protein
VGDLEQRGQLLGALLDALLQFLIDAYPLGHVGRHVHDADYTARLGQRADDGVPVGDDAAGVQAKRFLMHRLA